MFYFGSGEPIKMVRHTRYELAYSCATHC